jgi:hypothetical protein
MYAFISKKEQAKKEETRRKNGEIVQVTVNFFYTAFFHSLSRSIE